ncbi:MAG: hypothetical protein EBY22_15770, partial [Gammaproteobacteria bacterium]|nr:hypothetical protein [Gammaproteobacteria bacterium]
MKLGIMQPYLFPYIGYFQLIESCDCFVVYDDVQYIKNGWINRNRILLNGKIHYITLPVLKNGSLLSINQRVFPYDFEFHKRSLLSKIEQAYRKAPFFKGVYDMVEECFQSTDSNVAVFVTQTIQTDISGRYVRIRPSLTIGDGYLHLSQVIVTDPAGNNISNGKAAFATSLL